MNVSKKLLLLLFLVSIQCYGQNITNDTTKIESDYTRTTFDEFNISLVRLIATPEKYDGKKIQIIGYLNLEFEGNAIYLHKEDYDHSISENGIWVELPGKGYKIYNKKYVIMVGIFDMKSHGHMGMFGGTIKNITRLDVWNF